MEGTLENQELKEKCVKALAEVGASKAYCDFFAEVLQCEHDINTVVHHIHQSMDNEKTDTTDPTLLLKGLQDLTKNYNLWRSTIDNLCQKSLDIPPLVIDPQKLKESKSLKVQCNLETKEVNLHTGDELIITDTTQPNRLKVRTSGGEEGYIPALCCLLPSPDKNALTATERLRIELLAAFTESVKKLRSLLLQCLNMCSHKLATDWKSQLPKSKTASGGKDRVGRRIKRLRDLVGKQTPSSCDLTKLHNAIFSLEKELSSYETNGTDVTAMTEKVAALDKSVLCYQMLAKQWHMYRRSLESAPRPIRVVDHWEQLKPKRSGRAFRYFEVKTTHEEVETVEEIVYANSRMSSQRSSRLSTPGHELDDNRSGSGSKRETVQTDQITSTQAEERRTFIIRAVVDPRDGKEISIKDAISWGIVDQNRGLYVNPSNGDSMPIPEAMNTGKIKVEFSTARRSKEETKAVGLITIKTRVDNRNYTIEKAIDASTGERLDPETAKKRGILDLENHIFTIISTKEQISLEDAIDSGWVLVEYEEEEEEPVYETKMYAVSAVVDQKAKKKVPFFEAVQRGLIEKDTGNYVNNQTGEHIYVAEAIKRGFLKAREIEDTKGLNIEAENKVVIERMDKMRTNVLKSVGVLNAFKKAASARSSASPS